MLVDIHVLGLIAGIQIVLADVPNVSQGCMEAPVENEGCTQPLRIFYYDKEKQACKSTKMCPPENYGNAFSNIRGCKSFCVENQITDEAKSIELQDRVEEKNIDGPYFTSKEKIYIRRVEDSVTLRCEIKNLDSTGNSIVSWTQNRRIVATMGMILWKGDKHRMAMKSNNLFIRDLKESDEGLYKCEVYQLNATTDRLKVIMQNTPLLVGAYPIFKPGTEEETSYWRKTGDTVKFNCAVRDQGNASVIWKEKYSQRIISINKKMVWDDGRYKIEHPDAETYNLIITNLKQEDAGKYKCQIETLLHFYQDMQSRILTVAAPPTSEPTKDEKRSQWKHRLLTATNGPKRKPWNVENTEWLKRV